MTIARGFRLIAGLAGAAALGVQFGLLLDRMGGDIAAATVRFFTYFTLLSNLIAAATFLAPGLAPQSSLGGFFLKPSVRTAATLYLLVVGAVYHAVLASRWDPQGLQLAADITLHTIMPLAMLADWLLLTDKRGLSLAMAPPSLLFPFGYGVWALGLASMNGFYPYPFLDAATLGYLRVGLNLFILIAIFAALCVVMVLAGRRLPMGARLSGKP